MKIEEGISHKYNFSGDRYIDYALSYWLEWWNKENRCEFDPTNKQLDEMFLYEGFDKLAEIIFEEFPICARTTNCDFDAKWCWDLFTDTKEGRKAEAWLDEKCPTFVENAYFLDDLDKSMIAETFVGDPYDTFKAIEKSDVGKMLSGSDMGALENAIQYGEIGEFENGYKFGADEFAFVLMNSLDGEHDRYDIQNEAKKHMDYIKKGILLGTWVTNFNDAEAYVLYGVDLKELAEKAAK